MDAPKFQFNRRAYSRTKSKKNYYRNASSYYGLKIKGYLLDKYNHRCLKCDSTDNLQVDHIISVYLAFDKGIKLEELNSFDNLQILCIRCNSGKKPEDSIDYRGAE